MDLNPTFNEARNVSIDQTHSRYALGVLTTLNFIGACDPKVYLIFVDPKSKISEKLDPY